VRRHWLRMLTAAAAPIIAVALPSAPAQATPGVPVLPGGRQLVADPAIGPAAGMPVCHFGVVTGESCGTIQAVYNGWFTMANGVVSDKGDSGGPVYSPTPDGRAAIIGMFNSTWGQFPAAVSWQSASQQAREDVISAASGSVGAPTPEPWSAPAP
jgi:hypothetical protein